MSSLQKTQKYLLEICSRRDVICNLLYRCSYAERCVERIHNILLASDIKHTKNDIMPKRNKKVNVDCLKTPKVYCTSKKKTDSKKSIKDKKRGKQKSVVSQFLIETNVENNDSDDIVIVFDSTAGKRRETEAVASSSESEDSDDMGNVNSERYDPSVFRSVLQNRADWTSDDIQYTTSEQTTSRNQFLIIPSCPSQVFSPHKDSPERRKLKSMRQWKFTKFGSKTAGQTTPHLMFTLLSYNVLAQDLLESHPYLYSRHQSKALTWEYRRRLLLKELKEADADIMCLQEVQESHMESFYSQLKTLGYDGIFKKRTGDNVDGVAIYFKKKLFDLVDYTSVEYFQPGIDVLNRHNVGLIAKLAVKRQTENEQQHVVVATTHLLFNPKRHDVKLAQMQLLLTELERFSFQGFKYGTAVYWPVIMTGDMNFEPNTGVYRLITEGMFRYQGLSSKTLDDSFQRGGRVLDKELIPKCLDILDTCQHWGILCKRLIERMDHKTELRLLKVYNSDHERIMRELNMTKHATKSFEDFVENARSGGLINNFVPSFGPSPIPPMPDAGYATGQLTHNLNLRSVYSYRETDENTPEVTTFQNRWVTVDYIFFSGKQNRVDDGLKLVAKYKLLSASGASAMGPIPNMASPSDHYPLMAAFYLRL